MEFFGFSHKVTLLIYSFFGFGGALMGHKLVLSFIRSVKTYFLTKKGLTALLEDKPVEVSSESTMEVKEDSKAVKSSYKKTSVNYKRENNNFIKMLTISLLIMYLVHEYVYLTVLFFKDINLFHVENDKFLDFLTTWAGISLAYHFFTKADNFFSDKISFKRK